ncbi:S9 family peptidase [Propionibacteriaceae bacterium G1746]|uniref:S9 family peptidase n=1 Tax=Aestuariimicrobium sp. G57 TaxID=3418485 RepID=UPI003C2A6366
MRPDQVDLLTTLSAPSLSPDGNWAVVSATRPDFNSDEYVGQLWRVPTDGSPRRRITRGHRDTAPRVSPDGSVIAFLRATPGNPPQLAVVEAAGGEPQVVTDAKLGVPSFAFSPDSATLAYVTRVPDKGRYGDDDDIPPAKEDPRDFTGNRLQANGTGWFRDRPAQVFTVAVPDLQAEPATKPVGRAKAAAKLAADDAVSPTEGAPQNPLVPTPHRVTDDHTDWSGITFTPDGTALLAIAARHDGREDDLANDIWRLPLDGGEPQRLTGEGELALAISGFEVVGEQVFFTAGDLGESRRDFVGNHAGVWVVDLGGATQPQRLSDLTVTSTLVARDGGVLFADTWRGTARLQHVDAEGTLTQLSDGELVVGQPDSAGGVVVATVTSPRSMGEVAVLRDGALQVLTDFSAGLASETTIVEPVEVTATSADGYPVHGWVITPAGEGPHPVLLNIHGGPYAAYDKAFFDEAQVYVEAGYAVVMCNPRGSWGYGTEHGRAIRGDMGNLDAIDVLAFLDHALATLPGLDGERVGIMGGSYGGYLTAWITASDHRWAGAIVERGFLDSWTFIGSSDIGWFFPREYTSYDRAEADRQSPMSYVHQVRTPTLVLHSELDLRCPIHQALQYYTLLRAEGVESELLVFPGENHELSRSGTPWHRRQRFEAILDWWQRHLPVEPA